MEQIKKIRISTIKIGKQFRNDLGDLEELAESIKDGLLQPICVTPKRELICGFRRLTACLDILGWKTIPARVIEIPSLFEGMLAENNLRKDFSVSERVEIYRTIRTKIGSRRGQRSDLGRDNWPEVKPGQRTDDYAAKKAGLRNRKTADRAGQVVQNGSTKLVAAMDSNELSISAAAEIAVLTKPQQKKVLEQGIDHGKLVARQVRAFKVENRYQEHVAAQLKNARTVTPKTKWKVTGSQRVVKGDLLIADPPYGILDEDWEPDDLEQFTRDWAKKWSKCGADYIAIFFSQRHLWDGRKWLDESLTGYQFQQMLMWHAPNSFKPKSRQWFKQSWEPIFLYRKSNSERLIHDVGSEWTGELHDLDCQTAPVPQTTFAGDNFRKCKCQKPVATMKWLINALSQPGEKVVSLFSGVSPCGIAAVQLGRTYHGIEIDKELRREAEERLAAFGMPERLSNGKIRKPRPNSVTHGNCMDLIPLLDDRSVNLCLCSPPYGQQRNGHYRGVHDMTLTACLSIGGKINTRCLAVVVQQCPLSNSLKEGKKS